MTDTPESSKIRTFVRRRFFVLLCIFAFFVIVGAGLLYESCARRTVLLEVLTSTVSIQLSEDLDPLAIGPFWLCAPRAVPDPLSSEVDKGCPLGSFDLTMLDQPSVSFPKGSTLEFRIVGDRLEIETISLPDAWSDAESGFAERAVLFVAVERLYELGQLTGRGFVKIGTRGSVYKGALHEGRYEIYGEVLSGVLHPFGSELKVLREAPLPAGAFVRFVDAAGEDVIARLQVSAPQRGRPAFQVLALSAYAPVDLRIELFQTEPIMVRPTLSDAIGYDPVLLIAISLLGGAAALQQLIQKRVNDRG